MLAYFLKVNVAIVLFYAFYRLFFYKDTFFGWRRTALLCFFAVSAAVPLLNIQTWITEQEPMVAMADLYASVVLPELTIGTEAAPTDWKSILSEYANIAYWGIVALLMIRLVMQLAGIIHLACRCRKVQIGNTNIYGFDGKYKDRIRLQDTVNCILSQNYYLMDADRIWGHNKMKLSPETPSVFYMDRNTMSLTGIATWNSALLPMDEVLSVSNLLGGNVAYGGDLAMAEFVGDRKYYTAINSPSLWKSKDAIRVKQAFNDTIYTISEQGLTPYLVFELGEWHWNEQQQLDVEGCDKKIAIDYILENAEYIYFHFHTSLYLEESQSYCGFYHKEKKTVVCQKGDSLFDKMNNQHIQIRGVTSDGHFFALLQPDELSDDNQRRMGVEEEGNPIMVMLY